MNVEQKSRRVSSLCVLSSAALAAAATARQAGAAIVVTHVNQSVGFGAGDTAVDFLPLAGGVQAGVATTTFAAVSHSVFVGGTSAANFKVKTQVFGNYGFARPLPAGVKFSAAPAGSAAGGYIEYVSSGGVAVGPGLFSNQYFAFSFVNGGQTDYGWLEGSLTDATYAGLTYNINTYAYDDTGAQIATGQTSAAVPEPTSAGLAALLVAGAAGVRRHKRDRTAAAAA